MQLWSIQPAEVWEILKKEKEMFVNPALCSFLDEQIFVAAYDWIRGKMQERIPEYGGRHPWWAWHTYINEKRRKPDLRLLKNEYSNEPYVRLELNVPDHEVLLTNFDGYMMVVNHRYLAFSEEEDGAFYSKHFPPCDNPEFASLSELRIKIEQGYDPGPAPVNEEFKNALRQSWEAALDLKAMKKNEWLDGDTVQACFEVLRLKDVKKIDCFTGK
jgi:hypothetical protein